MTVPNWALEVMAADMAHRWGAGDRRPAEGYALDNPALVGDGPAIVTLLAAEAKAAGLDRRPSPEYLGRLVGFLGVECPLDLLDRLARELHDLETTLPQVDSAQEHSKADSDGLYPGFRLGKYTLVQKLGHGGMGAVWLAHPAVMDGGWVALKIRPDLARAHAQALGRFRREAQLTAQLKDVPGVIPILDYGEENGIAYYAMKYQVPTSLRDELKKIEDGRRTLTAEQAVQFIEEVARIVDEIHRAGIVHRDIKPDNIMVGAPSGPISEIETALELFHRAFDDPSGSKDSEEAFCDFLGWMRQSDRVWVIDFGLAARKTEAPAQVGESDGTLPPTIEEADCQTETGQLLGTRRYMAPERFQGPAGDTPAADIFSLGVTLCELLTGSWSKEDALAARRGELDPRPLRRAGVPLVLEQICMKCLAQNPADRYPTAAAFADALCDMGQPLPVVARDLSVQLPKATEEVAQLARNADLCKKYLRESKQCPFWDEVLLVEAVRCDIAQRIANASDGTLWVFELTDQLVAKGDHLYPAERLFAGWGWFNALGKQPARHALLRWPSVLLAPAAVVGAWLGLILTGGWGQLSNEWSVSLQTGGIGRAFVEFLWGAPGILFAALLGGLPGALRFPTQGWGMKESGHLLLAVAGAALGGCAGVAFGRTVAPVPFLALVTVYVGVVWGASNRRGAAFTLSLGCVFVVAIGAAVGGVIGWICGLCGAGALSVPVGATLGGYVIAVLFGLCAAFAPEGLDTFSENVDNFSRRPELTRWGDEGDLVPWVVQQVLQHRLVRIGFLLAVLGWWWIHAA